MRAFLPALATFLFVSVAMPDELGVVIRSGDTFVADGDLICRTPEAFRRIVVDAAKSGALEAEASELTKQVMYLSAALEQRTAESKALQMALDASKKEAEVYRELSESMTNSWNAVNDELRRSEKRGRPFITHGPSIGVGMTLGEERDLAGYVGWGFTFDIMGRR